jgi:hypothetical protein
MTYPIGSSTKLKARRAKSLRLLKRFEEAVDCKVFKGSHPPDEHAQIEAEYVAARKAILAHMNEV